MPLVIFGPLVNDAVGPHKACCGPEQKAENGPVGLNVTWLEPTLSWLKLGTTFPVETTVTDNIGDALADETVSDTKVASIRAVIAARDSNFISFSPRTGLGQLRPSGQNIHDI